MKELTVFEMEEISGGYSWDFSSLSSSLTSLVSNGVEAVGAAILGGTIAAVAGTLIGGTQSGANGGLLGFGLLGNLVGMFWGLAMGLSAERRWRCHRLGWDTGICKRNGGRYS